MFIRFILCLTLSIALWNSHVDGASFIATEQDFLSIRQVETDALSYLARVAGDGKTRLIVVRHGESLSNAGKIIDGRLVNSDLSSVGVEQVKELGKRLKRTLVAIDLVYSSPSIRAVRTAELILKQGRWPAGNKPSIVLDPRLYERYFGPYEGATVADYLTVLRAQEEFGSGPNIPFEEKMAYKFHPDMESYGEVGRRFLGCLTDIASKHQGKTILVTTHGAAMKAAFILLCHDEGYDLDYIAFDLFNRAVLIFEEHGEGLQVVASSHLKFR